VREAITAVDATREASMAWDNATLCVNDAEDWAALVEREALERVSRVEVENAMMLASAHEDAEGLARKVALHKDELTVVHRA
jgi:hypothetical protein